MADSIIGAIRAILQLDTAAFTQGAKEAETVLASLEKTFKRTAQTLGVGLSVGFAAKEFKAALDAADELNKASQKFGVGVEQLSSLKYAAELADVSFEALGKGLKKLSQAMVDSLTKPTSDAAVAFEALGISMEDLRKSTPEQIFGKIADGFSRLEDGAGKTSLAVTLFGKAGADLIPLLNGGADAINKATREAEALGIVVSSKTAKAAEEFNDNMKALNKTAEAIALRFAADLAPALADFTAEMKKGKIEGGGIQKVFEFIDKEVALFIFNFKVAALQVSEMGKAWTALKTLMTAPLFSPEFKKASDELDNAFRAIRDASKTVAQSQEEAAKSTELTTEAFSAFEQGQQAALKANKALDAQFVANIDSLKKLTEEQNKNLDAARIAAQAAGAGADAQLLYKFALEAAKIEAKDSTEVLKKLQEAELVAAEAARLLAAANEKTSFKSLEDGIKGAIDQLRVEQATLGQSAGARAAAIKTMELEKFIRDKLAETSPAEIQKLRDEIAQYGQLTTALQLATDARNRSFEVQKLQAQGQNAINAALNPSIAATAQQKYVTEQLIAEQQKGNALIPSLVASITSVGKAQGDLAVATAAANLIVGNRTPYDQLILQQQQHQEILKAYPQLYQQVADAQQKTTAQMVQLQGQAVGNLLSSTSQVFMALGAKNKAAFETGKAFAIAAATVNSFLAFTKALSIDPLPFPFNYAAAAATLAAGLAQVIQIKSQKFTGAAMGGSFKVPGGMMGVDKRLIPMALAPGERVDVTPASQAQAGGDRTLNIPAIRSKDFFTGDTVRDMVLAIDQWMRDGGTGVRVAGVQGLAR